MACSTVPFPLSPPSEWPFPQKTVVPSLYNQHAVRMGNGIVGVEVKIKVQVESHSRCLQSEAVENAFP